MIKKLSLNPKSSIALFIISMIVFFLNLEREVTNNYIAFLLGFFVTYPLITNIWRIIKKHWKDVYEKFYESPLFMHDSKIAMRSGKLTWWMVPYCLVVYGFLTIIVITYFGRLAPYSFLTGALSMIAVVSYRKQKVYYRRLK